ncbi:MAG: polysaccharide biosynthesis tyrosine autokinase [Actinomycetota bacterium]
MPITHTPAAQDGPTIDNVAAITRSDEGGILAAPFDNDPRDRSAPASGSLRLADLQSILSIRKWTVIGVAAVTVGVAMFLSFRQTPIYESTASVLVRTNGQAEGPVEQANMATERRLAESTAVARVARDRLGLAISLRELLADLSVEVPVDTELLEFHYSDPRPAEAQRRAQGFANAYLTYRREQALAEERAAERSIQTQIVGLNQRLATVQGEIAATDDSEEEAALQAEANSLITQIAILQQRLAGQGGADVAAGAVVERAEVPQSPAHPNHVVDGVLGLLAGLVLGAGAALAQDYADDRIRDREEFEGRIGTAVLGAIPTVKGLGSATEHLVATGRDVAAGEAFRRLRTNLMFSAMQLDAKVVLVTSAKEREGKTFTAANLGAALATAGKSVVLVSADLRRPRLEEIFGLPKEFGLVDVLMQLASPRSALQPTGIENLLLLPSGPAPSNPAELLGSSTMSSMLAELRHFADFVLLDSAPLLPVTDAAVLVPSSDAVLYVADARSATRGDIKEARRQLERVDARVIGAALLNAPPETFAAYGYYRQA